MRDLDAESGRLQGEILDEIFGGDTSNYRLLLETSVDPVGIFDVEGNFVFVSPAFAALLGTSTEVLAGTSGFPLVHPDDVDRFGQELEALLESGEWKFAEFRLRRSDGEYVHVWGVTRTFVAQDGKTLILAFVHDMTAAKRAEEALQAVDERYRSLIEGIEAVVWEAEPKSLTYTFVSRRAVDLLGYPIEDWFVPGFWQAHLHPGDRELTIAAQVRAIEAGTDHELLYRMRNADGADVWLRDRIRLVWGEEGEVELLRGVTVDVTAQVEAQAERERLEAELRQAQKLDAIGQLAGGIAHDFNNLLTAIGGYAELALSDPRADPVRQELEEIRRAGERAAGLTRQLLAFSRRQELAPELVDLNAVIVEMGGMLQRLIGTHVELVIDLAPELGRTVADPSQLQQIVLNLTVNARDAMPAGGRLHVRTENVGRAGRRFVGLCVNDNGVGMDEETRDHLFEPFFTTKPLGEGTGLGLATVHGIVGQFGGEIEVDSEPGRGTTFRILLPAADAPA